MRDITKGEDPQVKATLDLIVRAMPDVLVLTAFDFDYDQIALSAFVQNLAASGLEYPYFHAIAGNSGVFTGLDLDGNGRRGEPRDAQGYGEFAGQGALAVLSRYPILTDQIRDFSTMLWRDLPDAQFPMQGGKPYPSAKVAAVQRLSSTAHAVVPIELPDGTKLQLLMFRAGTPAFDNTVGRNRARNSDEVLFWVRYLDGQLALSPPASNFVVIGDANLDPADGLGNREAIQTLISHPKLQDPRPRSNAGQIAAEMQGGVNQSHRGDPGLDTADWRDENGPGNLRVDYVLPSRDMTVAGSGVLWPTPQGRPVDPAGNEPRISSRHGLVWVDVEWSGGE